MYLNACVSNDVVATDPASAIDSFVVSSVVAVPAGTLPKFSTSVNTSGDLLLAKHSSAFASKIKMGQTLLRLTHFESGCGGRI
jgi:hypothetical protein